MSTVQIILINGASSAGKTSIARELRSILPEPFLHTGLDDFLTMLAPRYRCASPTAAPGFHWLIPDAPGPGAAPEPVQIRVGPAGHRLVHGYHRAVAALAAAGNSLIVDDLLLEGAWLADWVEALAGLPVLFVGLRCPLEVAEEREMARGDRVPGMARGSYDRVHGDWVYDLEVNSGRRSALACAEIITRRLLSGRPGVAFDRLRQAYGLG